MKFGKYAAPTTANAGAGTTTLTATRRTVLLGAAASGLAAPFVNRLVGSARAQVPGVVNYAGYGGSYGEALRDVWFNKFEAETGIKVNLGVGANLALAKLQVLNPAGAEWDIVDLTNAEYLTAVKENMLLPMGKDQVDTSKILPEYVKSHGFCYVTFVYVMGRNRGLVSDADAPQSWADFMSARKYRSKRALNAVQTSGVAIEAALLGDGVAPRNMYPVDVDRAFASLEKLGRDRIVWTTSLQEPVQRIGSGETPVGGIYTGRALMANRQGANIGFSLKQGIIGGDTLGVIRNSRNSKAAFMLLNYMATRGDLAAEFTARTSYGIPHVDVDSLLPASANDIRAALPTNPDLRQEGLITNDAWWADNLAKVVTRFQQWQLS